MSDQFLAEIRIFPFSYAPAGWAMCNGQLMPIVQSTALFSLIGTAYGGDGSKNFALPDLEGNVPLCCSQIQATNPPPSSPPALPPGLSTYNQGDFGGGQTFTLDHSQNPPHNHSVNTSSNVATSASPAGNVYAKGQYVIDQSNTGAIDLYDTAAPGVTLSSATIGLAGGGQPHNNMMPSLALNFCIALTGVFPSRG